MPEYKEGNTHNEKFQKFGGSTYLLISPEMREYLSVEDNGEIVIKFDKGKHGRFIGIGKA